MNKSIAFLGTGLMGAPMIRRLLAAGFCVRVWNRSPEKARALARAGACVALTPADAVADMPVVCLCLTDGQAISSLLFSDGGIASSLPQVCKIIDFSTIGPCLTREIAERLKAIRPEAIWIDAPVSGGVKGAENGELVILCGGEKTAVDTVRSVLAPLSKRISHLGPLGSGQAAKLCNQLIVATNIVSVAEALALGRAQGLDISTIPVALQGGWADSLPLQIIGKRMAEETLEPMIAAISIYVKDLALVLENAPGTPRLAHAANDLFKAAASAMPGDPDVSALLNFLEMRNLTAGGASAAQSACS